MIPAISVQGLNVAYGTHWVLKDIDLECAAGAMTAIVGPNGAGKSTLLKAVLGLVPRVSGHVEFFGSPHSEQLGQIAYVPQRESIDWDFPISVDEVALMGTAGPRKWFGRPTRAQRETALRALESVQLTDLRHRQIGQLSGGQQQRLFLARALAQDARLMMLDEPFAGVDAVSQQSILEILQQFVADGGTVVAVHHDLSTVKRTFDQAILLHERVLAAGPVAKALTKANLTEAYGGWYEPEEER